MKSKIKAEAINAEATIDAWFEKLIHGTIIQRDGELHNKFHAAKEELKQFFAPAKTEEQPAVATVEKQTIEESK